MYDCPGAFDDRLGLTSFAAVSMSKSLRAFERMKQPSVVDIVKGFSRALTRDTRTCVSLRAYAFDGVIFGGVFGGVLILPTPCDAMYLSGLEVGGDKRQYNIFVRLHP